MSKNAKDVLIEIRAANLTEKALKEVQAGLKLLESSGDQASRKIKASWSDMASAVGVVTGAVAAVSGSLVVLGQRGAAIQDVRGHFEGLNRTIGESADVMLSQLRAATLGTISDFDLMKTANLAMSQGLKLNADQMGLLGDTAAVLADRVGGDTKQAYEILMQAMATGQDRTLKQIGLNIDATLAQARYAESLGKTAKDLTEVEKTQAIANAILGEGQRIVTQSGKAQADFGDQIGRSTARLSNFLDGIGTWVSSSPGIEKFSGVMTAAAGSISAVGLSLGPLKSGLSQVLPMLGGSGGLAALLKTVGSAASAVALPLTLLGGAIAYTISKTSQLRNQIDSLEQASRLAGRGIQTLGEAEDILRANRAGLNGAVLKGTAVTLDMAAAWQKGREEAEKGTKAMATAADRTAQLETATQGGAITLRAFADAAALGVDPLKTLRATAEGLRNNALMPLTTAQREVIRLFIEGGASASEIAGQMKVSEGAVVRYQKALEEQTRASKQSREEDEARRKQLQALSDSLSGKNEIKAAQDLLLILQQLRPVQQLTADAQAQINSAMGKAIDAYTSAGQIAPRALFDTYVATLPVATAIAGINELLRQNIGLVPQFMQLDTPTIRKGLDGLDDLLAKTKVQLPGLKGQTFGGNLSTFVGKELGPSIRRAFEGGGNPGKAIGASLTGGILGSIGKEGLGKLVASKLGGTLGATIGSIVPGLGTMVGGLLGGKISTLIGGLFGGNKDKKDNADATKQVGALGAELVKTYGSMENLQLLGRMTGKDIAGSFGSAGKAGLEQFKVDSQEFQKRVAELKTKINTDLGGILQEATGLGFRLPPTLEPYLAKLREMGLLTEDNQRLLALMGDDSVIDFKKMEEAAGRYGISIDGLGTKFNQAKMSDAVRQILEDYDLLTRGGADAGAVLGGMADEVSEVAQRAMRLGLQLPENMRPIIEALIKSGTLLDENGNKIEDLNKLSFGDPIKVGLDRIADLLEKLVKAFGIELPAAIGKVPRAIDIDVNYRTRRSRMEGYDEGETDPGSSTTLPGAAAGGVFTRPTFRVIAERQPEIVGSPNAISDALATAMERTGFGAGAARGSSLTHVTLVAAEGGRPLAAAMVPMIPQEVKSRVGKGRRR